MGVFNREEVGLEVDNKSAETIIGPSVKVEGTFQGEADVLVQGGLVGNLKTKGNLTIAEGAKVEAEVEAANLLVSGEVTGNIKCQGKIELTPSAKVFGDIETQIICVQTGAVIQGKCLTNLKDSATQATLASAKRDGGAGQESSKKKK